MAQFILVVVKLVEWLVGLDLLLMWSCSGQIWLVGFESALYYTLRAFFTIPIFCQKSSKHECGIRHLFSLFSTVLCAVVFPTNFLIGLTLPIINNIFILLNSTEYLGQCYLLGSVLSSMHIYCTGKYVYCYWFAAILTLAPLIPQSTTPVIRNVAW